MKEFFKSVKNTLAVIGITLIIGAVIYGIFWVDYKIWRAEHPNAKTWTFFIHSSR